MARPAGMVELFTALRSRWRERGADEEFPGGVHTKPVPLGEHQPVRPYVVLESGNEDTQPADTGRDFCYCDFKMTVVADVFEELGPLVGLLKESVNYAPLDLRWQNDCQCVECVPGTVTYGEQGTYQIATVPWKAWLAQQSNRSPD